MNPGGEPERDDTGLPPVDIEIPDDARELDRDVQAYRRELRALRRSDRRGRWHRSLSKDGVALPLLACCLVLALITGTLLTVFTVTASPSQPGVATSAPARPAGPLARMVRNQPLPAATIAIEGSTAIQVQALNPGILVLVPRGCDCRAAFDWLAGVASKASTPAYVIYSSVTNTEVQQLYSELTSEQRGWVLPAKETDNKRLLSPAHFPAGIQADRVTAILITPDRRATWVSQISPSDSQVPLVQALTGQSA